MLKLMKYEFRKLRTPLLVMVLILAGLEIGFLAGYKLEKTVLTAISVTLLTTLVFVSYAFLLIAGVVAWLIARPDAPKGARAGLWLIAGGVMYSVGAILYGLGKKIRYMHAVFHLFVILGSLLQFICIYLWVL